MSENLILESEFENTEKKIECQYLKTWILQRELLNTEKALNKYSCTVSKLIYFSVMKSMVFHFHYEEFISFKIKVFLIKIFVTFLFP